MALSAAPAGGSPVPDDDLCALLERAADRLAVGELLAPPDFDLFAVMNAAEIGNMRLDTGAGPEARTPDAAGPADLSPADTLAVMDRLTAMEATWHAGQPLVQTIYTCHYLIDPGRISHLVSLSAFCTSLRVTTRLLSDLCFETASVAREEDFLPHMCGFTQARGLPDAGASLEELQRAEARLERLQKPGQKAGRRVQGADEAEAALAGPLLCRLRVRRCLLQALVRLLSGEQEQLDSARKVLAAAQQELERARESAGAAAEAEAPGFDPDVHRHLLGPAPPRAVHVLPAEQAWARHAELLAQLQGVCEVTRVSRWWELKEFLEAFAASGACAVARMVMAAALALPEGAPGAGNAWVPGAAMLRPAMGLPRAGSAHACDAVEPFLQQAELCARDWAHGRCLNRARQRRWQKKAVWCWHELVLLGQAVEAEPDFRACVAAAERTWATRDKQDEFSRPCPGPLSAWAGRECCLDLQQHLVLGFELGLYREEEHCMIHWYCEFVLSCELRQLELLREWLQDGAGCTHAVLPSRVLQPRPKERARERAAGGGGRKRERCARGNQAAADAAERDRWAQESLVPVFEAKLALGQRALRAGTMRLAAALRGAKLVPQVFVKGQGPWNSDEQVFEQRFHCFSGLAIPPSLTFTDYHIAMTHNAGIAGLVGSALQSFDNAGRVLSKHKGVKLREGQTTRTDALERVARMNHVASSLLMKLLDSEHSETAGLTRAGQAWQQTRRVQASWLWADDRAFPRLSVGSRAPGG